MKPHPYDHEIGRLERLLEAAGQHLGSEVKGSRATAALLVGTAQEVLRTLSYRLFNEHCVSRGDDVANVHDGKGSGQ